MKRHALPGSRPTTLLRSGHHFAQGSGWRRLIALGSIFTFIIPTTILVLEAPTDAGPTPCTDASSACVISAATTYLNALVSHNASQVRLAPNAIRTENGFDTGDGGANIANDLATNPQYLVVGGIRDVRWFVDGDEAIAFYLLDAKVPVLGVQFATTHLAERFKVDNGLITEIEAIDCTHPGIAPETERTTTPIPLISEQCIGQ